MILELPNAKSQYKSMSGHVCQPTVSQFVAFFLENPLFSPLTLFYSLSIKESTHALFHMRLDVRISTLLCLVQLFTPGKEADSAFGPGFSEVR